MGERFFVVVVVLLFFVVVVVVFLVFFFVCVVVFCCRFSSDIIIITTLFLMLNKTLIDFYFRHILPFLFVSFCTMSRKVVCRSKCCSQGGGKSRYVVVGWEQGFGNAPPPCPTPRTPPPPRIILLNCRSFDNMDELSARVNFTNEFSERFSKRYLPFAKSEETIDRKTAIIMVGCLRTVKKKTIVCA